MMERVNTSLPLVLWTLADKFESIVAKGEVAHQEQFLLLITKLFSTLFNNDTLISRDVSYVCLFLMFIKPSAGDV